MASIGGHLRWVQTFAGPNSSVAVVIGGQSYEVNRALRFATTIDSNSNGIPNYALIRILSTRRQPFSTSLLTLKASLGAAGGAVVTNGWGRRRTKVSPSGLALSWLAVPNAGYTVHYTTNLALAITDWPAIVDLHQ
jgi:hypothetical protein